MTAGPLAHAIVITVGEPPEVAVGAHFVLTISVSCPAGCDLSGVPIEVTEPDGTRTTIKFGVGDTDSAAAARRVLLKAPLQAGEPVWCISCAAHETNGRHHDASLLRVPVQIQPYQTSLAVWAIPCPVITGQSFAIKVGAKSAAGCDLSGMPIAVHDEAGAVLASSVLGEKPWPGTSALYWSELALIAPTEAGMFSWSVEFSASDLALPHRGASSRFSVAIVDPPEHKLTVKVVERETAIPVENAQVRLGAYRAATAASGIAELMLPKGSYDLNVWKPGYEAPATTIAINADLAVEVMIAFVPEENPDAAWLM
jgi:hypothetical protein